MKCNTGYCFTPDEQTLFLSIQHPKEGQRIRRDQAIETHVVTVTTTKGEKFQQICSIAVGSNCLDKSNNAEPKPGTIAIQSHRQSG